jgi:hypothetical protein
MPLPLGLGVAAPRNPAKYAPKTLPKCLRHAGQTPAHSHLGRLRTKLPTVPTVVLSLPTVPLWAGNPHG